MGIPVVGIWGLLFFCITVCFIAQEKGDMEMAENEKERLLVLWTTGDKITAMNMVLMYSHNAKLHAWWDEVTLLIWGAASKLVVEDEEIDGKLAEMLEAGVQIIACKKCAENLGIVERLEKLGIKVFYTGEYLTKWLKSGQRMITI